MQELKKLVFGVNRTKIIYLTGLIQFTCLAFQNYFCHSISDSLVVLSTHKVLIHRGNLSTLDEMKIQNIERYSKGTWSEVKVLL